jgi:hypothetical protein
LFENESPILPAELSRVKVYGDVVLLGGEKGFLGFGVVSRAHVHNSDPRLSAPTSSPRKVVLCIPFYGSQLLTGQKSENDNDAEIDNDIEGNY